MFRYLGNSNNILAHSKMYIEVAKGTLSVAVDILVYNKIHIEGLQRLQKLQGFRQTLLKTRTLSRKLFENSATFATFATLANYHSDNYSYTLQITKLPKLP
jgi:hypothetical protein